MSFPLMATFSSAVTICQVNRCDRCVPADFVCSAFRHGCVQKRYALLFEPGGIMAGTGFLDGLALETRPVAMDLCDHTRGG